MGRNKEVTVKSIMDQFNTLSLREKVEVKEEILKKLYEIKMAAAETVDLLNGETN